MTKSQLLFLLVCALSGGAFAQTAPPKKFVSKDNLFEVSYPADWDLGKQLPVNLSFVALSRQQHDSDMFQENVNIMIDDLEGNDVTAEEYAILCKPMIRRMITDYKEVESKKIKLGGKDAYMLIYTGKQGVYALKYNQVLLVDKGKAYIITYTSEPANYNTFIKAFGLIANSIVIK